MSRTEGEKPVDEPNEQPRKTGQIKPEPVKREPAKSEPRKSGPAKTGVSKRKLPKILPTGSESDSHRSWGDSDDSNDERLRHEKPPHW